MKKPTQRESRQILAALALVAIIGAGAALWKWMTFETPPPLGDGATLEEIRLGSDREGERLIRLTEKIPGMLLSAWLFQGEHKTGEEFEIAEGDAIEFLPLVTDRLSGPAKVDVYLENEGGRTAIGSAEMVISPGLSVPADGAILRNLVRMELLAATGKLGRIVWKVEGAQPPPSAIACFKFVKARQTPRPSVLLICSDTHRYDYSLAGRGPELMPNLTAFAAAATVYDRAYSTASWTLPAVTSALTGRYPRYHLTGQRILSGLTSELDRDDTPPGNFVAVWGPTYHQLTTYPQELLSLPQAMRETGYTTVLIFANTFLSLSGLFADGFDVVFDATLMPGQTLDYLTESVLKALPADRPLFLYVHYLDVHEYVGRYQSQADLEADKAGRPRHKFYPSVEPPEVVREAYASSVGELDEALGPLLTAWDGRTGSAENMVVFYSDHGEHLFDPGQPRLEDVMIPPDSKFDVTFVTLQVPILNHGNSMSETLLHVPLAVRYPKSMGIAPGRESRAVSLVDIMPTILKIANAPASLNALDWKSLIPGDDAGTAPDASRDLYADYQLYGDDKSSIRRNQNKLTLNLTKQNERVFGEPDWVLVDTELQSDQGEKGQQITDESLRDELTASFGEYAENAVKATKGISSDHSPDLNQTTEALKRLGYIQ